MRNERPERVGAADRTERDASNCAGAFPAGINGATRRRYFGAGWRGDVEHSTLCRRSVARALAECHHTWRGPFPRFSAVRTSPKIKIGLGLIVVFAAGAIFGCWAHARFTEQVFLRF